MRIRAALALTCSVLLFFFVAGFLAFPEVIVMMIVALLKGEGASGMRVKASTHTGKWACRLYIWICRILHIHIHKNWPTDDDGRPAIIMANHLGAFDLLLMWGVAVQSGRSNNRLVIKRSILFIPIVGQLAWLTGAIPLKRNRDPNDRRAIAEGARKAIAEKASVPIFPEGTRFTGAIGGSGYRHLLPPKIGGFKNLRRELPDYPVLDITASWYPPLPPGSGTTVLDSLKLYGRDLRITGHLFNADQIDENWLEKRWHEKDDELASRQ